MQLQTTVMAYTQMRMTRHIFNESVGQRQRFGSYQSRIMGMVQNENQGAYFLEQLTDLVRRQYQRI